MVKIYRPLDDTWIIPYQTVQELKYGKPSGHIKYNYMFPDVFSSLRLGRNYPLQKTLYFDYYITNATANICISIKNTCYKFYFKNDPFSSVICELPSHILNFFNANAVGNFEIEINGMFCIEIDEYPAIPRTNTLTNILWKKKCKDFDIIVIDEEKNEKMIQIHKEVLMAQSLVFERMLQSGMEETETNTLKIIDFEFDTVKSAVQFFYGHEISDSLSFKDLFELNRFADKYFIDNLMDYIKTFISYRLTPSNVFEISNLANASTSAVLQNFCLEFNQALFYSNGAMVDDQDVLENEIADYL